MNEIQDRRILDIFQQEQKEKELIAIRKQQAMEQRRIKSQLEEDFKRVKRMAHRQKEAQAQAERYVKKQEYKEETVISLT